MKSTIHFFGDSFTEGYSLKKTDYIWPKLISKGLGYKYKNYAQGASTPLFIIHQLIKSLTSVKKGDTVIVLETIPDRVELHSNELDLVVPITNGALTEALEGNIDYKYFNSISEVKTAFEFIYDHRYKKLGTFAKYYSGIYKDFGNYFKSINVEYILISYMLPFGNIEHGGKFETNRGLSKGKNNDAHFTLRGHWDFAKYVSDEYFNGKVDLPEKPKRANYII